MTEKDWSKRLISRQREQRTLYKRFNEVQDDIYECLNNLANIQVRRFKNGEDIIPNEHTTSQLKVAIEKKNIARMNTK